MGDEAMAVFNDMASPGEKLLVYNHKIHWTNGNVPVPVKEKMRAVPVRGKGAA